MTRPWLLALVCLFFARGVAQIASSEPKPIFVRCGTLIDGKSDRPQRNVVIEIRGEKIFAVNASAPQAPQYAVYQPANRPQSSPIGRSPSDTQTLCG